jgi:mRNA interferase RelE/StbE
VKKLKNRNDYRFRVGNWRVFFTDSLKILYIEEIKKRDEHTY